MRMEALEAGTGLGPDSSADIERLDGIVVELREEKDALSARVAAIEAGGAGGKPGRGVGPDDSKEGMSRLYHKGVMDSKVILNLAELTDDKTKFRQWNIKFINALSHVERTYGGAMGKIMACIDEGRGPPHCSRVGGGFRSRAFLPRR